MSQVRLSIELEVSQETVSAYENQRHYPSFPQMVKLSQLFDASIDYIMGLSPVRRAEEDQEGTAYVNALNACRRLNTRQLELVAAYAQGLADMGRLADKK